MELLTECSEPIGMYPWVKIVKTKTGEKLWDSQRLGELSRFLQKRAGLVFYYQLLLGSGERSTLHDHDWLTLVENAEEAEGCIVRDRRSGELRRPDASA